MGEPVFVLGLVFHLITHPYVCIAVKILFCSRESPALWPWAGPYSAIPFGYKSTRVIQLGLESVIYFQEWLPGANKEQNKSGCLAQTHKQDNPYIKCSIMTSPLGLCA